MAKPKIEIKINYEPPSSEEVGKAMVTMSDKKELDDFLTEVFFRLECNKVAFRTIFREALGPLTEEEDDLAFEHLRGLEVFRSPRPYCMMEYVPDWD